MTPEAADRPKKAKEQVMKPRLRPGLFFSLPCGYRALRREGVYLRFLRFADVFRREAPGAGYGKMAGSDSEITRILVAADEINRRCVEAALSLRESLEECGLPTSAVGEASAVGDGDLLVVLGGDGFLMHTLAGLNYPPVKVLGLNFGQVGFLMNHPDHLRNLAEIVCARKFVVTELPIISAVIKDGDGEREVFAINDFVLERISSQTTRLDIFIEGVLLNRYSGDGVIVSTAAGSTAYTLAAGGPVVHPDLHAIVVTPVNAHRPIQFHSLQFPLVLPLSSRLRIEVVDQENRPTRLVADGTSVGTPRGVAIGASGRSVQLLRTEDFNYVGSLVRKVIGANGG